MDNVVIQDFGEKVGGARKDLRGSVTREDIAQMTPEERLKLIRKDVVWPAPDYVKMVKEEGYTQKAAAMVKMMRDSFPATPRFRADATEATKARGAEFFAELLNAAKAVTQRGKTEAELAASFHRAPEAKEYLFDVVAKDPSGRRGLTINPSRKFGEAMKAAFDDGVQESVDIRRAMRTYAEGTLDSPGMRMLRRNSQWPEGTSLADGWLRKNNIETTGHNGGWALAYYGTVSNDEYQKRRLTGMGFGAMVGKTYSTQEEADSEMRKVAEAHFAAKRETAKLKRERVLSRALGRPVGIDAIFPERVGPDHRDGALATGEDYMQEFGLRGGEFGLWVNQEERQDVLNRGFDSFRDLASAFELPSSAISLGGKLAIAFGSRGRGGAAAAHYEPGRKVINLTKPSGEGCLAHEWGHALDHHLGAKAAELGLVAKIRNQDHANYLSNVTLKDRSAGAPQGEQELLIREFHAAMSGIATNRDPLTKKEVLKQAEHNRSIALENLMITTSRASDHLRVKRADESRFAEFETHMALLRTPEPGKEVESLSTGVSGLMSMREFKSSAMSTILANQLRFAAAAVTHRDEKAALPEDWQGMATPRNTAYVLACQQLDKDRSEPYYSLPHEMFARTLEAVVTDTLQERGAQNWFLVAGAAGEAYPFGDERAKLKARFGPLLEQLPKVLPAVSVRNELPKASVRTPMIPKAPETTSVPESENPRPLPPLPTPKLAPLMGTQLSLF